MKAFLLAAGYGTRLKPITDKMPKCLLPINGRPLMEWWILLLEKHGVQEVLINTHYLQEQVREYIEAHNRKSSQIRLIEYHEPILLGSAGTVAANREFIASEESFFICYADNLTNINLTALYNFHMKKEGVLSMALFRSSKPEQCGIAKMDYEGRIVDFVEKPVSPKSDLANAGIYVADNKIFKYLPKKSFADFGKDVLPILVGEMYGWETQGYLIDIGTHDNYTKAQEEWVDIIR